MAVPRTRPRCRWTRTRNASSDRLAAYSASNSESVILSILKKHPRPPKGNNRNPWAKSDSLLTVLQCDHRGYEKGAVDWGGRCRGAGHCGVSVSLQPAGFVGEV